MVVVTIKRSGFDRLHIKWLSKVPEDDFLLFQGMQRSLVLAISEDEGTHVSESSLKVDPLLQPWSNAELFSLDFNTEAQKLVQLGSLNG